MGPKYDPERDPQIQELLDHVIKAHEAGEIDVAIVAHRPDESISESELPKDWVLEKTEYVGGKRVRTYAMPVLTEEETDAAST